MRGALLVALLGLVLGPAGSAAAHCRCHRPYKPKCAEATAKHRLTVTVDLAAVDGTVEVLTQTGPYRMPAADLDGKSMFFLVTPRNVVFQGFLSEAIPGSIALATFHGTRASFTTDAAFLPGEYELALFVDVVPGGGLGPQRGDIAAFDNAVCDPTGVTVRFRVGCEDTTVTLTNRHFIIF